MPKLQITSEAKSTSCLDPQARQNLQSEYASMGRQGGGIIQQNVQIVDNKRATGYKNQYQSPKDPQVKQHSQQKQKMINLERGPKLTTVLSENIKTTTKSKQSSGNSEDCNQAADEDNQSSYIQYRNAYLDDEIQTAAEGSQFKQEPKMAKGTRPNPNLHIQNQAHTSLASHQNVLSPLSILGPTINQKQSNANRRIFDTNQVTTIPMQNQRSVCSQLAIQGPTQMSQHKKTTSGPQVGQVLVSQNTAKNGARRVVPQSKQLIEFVSPLTDKMLRPNTHIVVMPQTTKMAQTQKLVSEDQQNSSRKPHPMFQRMVNEDSSASKKQAMIHQFEMNLNPQNKAAAQVYSQREMTGQSGSMQGLMNKATLCDSAASKMNNNSTGSNSQFLRKSLWLLTNSKSRALKELVHQNKPACSLCNYIHSYSHLTIAANIQGSAVKQPHAQSIFQMTHHCNATKSGPDNYFSMQAGPSESHALHRMVVSQQKSSLETNKNRSNQNNTVANGTRSTIQSKSLHQQQMSLPTNLGNIQSNSRINLKIKSPGSPQSPESPTTPESQRDVYVSSHRKLRRTSQQKGNSMLSTSNASQHQNQNFQISSGSAFMQQMNSIILQQELHERFEAQYFYYLLKKSLITKYMTSQEYYNSKVSSDIMYNEQRHIVSVFKEYLIYDDFSEYLKRFYLRQESTERLPRIFEFYEHYSKVFPNYVAIPESKYMFKNIERKQKLIDQRHQNFLRNQKKEKGETKSDRSSALILFNSQFLKEVFDEPTMRDSLVSDPRDISINQFSRVLNNPPLQNKILDSYSLQNLNASKNHRELENIIQLLGKFDKFEDNSIMARELVSNSLVKESGVFLQSEIERVMMIGPHTLREPSRQFNKEINDLTMSSWAQQSMIINDQQIFARQDSEFELASEIQASANHSMLDLQKTPKISALPHGKFTFSKAKPFREGPQAEMRLEKKDSEQIREFLNEEIQEGKVVEKKQNKQGAQNRGIHLKQPSVPIQTDQDKTNLVIQGNKMTRNQELGSSKQQPQTITVSSQIAAPVLRPSVKSAVKTLSVLSNERQNSRTQTKEQLSGIQSQSNILRNTQQNSATHQSQGPQTFKQNIQNLMVEANKVFSSNKKSKESFNQKRASAIEQNFMSTDQLLDKQNYVALRNKDKSALEKAIVNQGSRNDKVFEERKSNSFEAMAKQSMPLLQPRTSVINIEMGKLRNEGEIDLNQIYKFTKHGSRTSLAAAATHQPQTLTKTLNFNKFEDEPQNSAINLKINRRHAQGGPIVLDLNDDQQNRFNKQSKLIQTESRKIKTSVGLREQDFLSEGSKAQVKGNIFVQDRSLTKQLEHTNFEQLKVTKTTIQSLLNTQHLQSKQNLVSKPKKSSNPKPIQTSLPTKEQQIALNNVYQSSNQGRSTNQITPYALLNYYSKDTNGNVESQKVLQQPFQQTEVKERLSKSEGLQKTEKFAKTDNYQTRQEQKTPQRMPVSTDQITNGLMAESATLAAVKYFQSNAHSNQSNPYEKTGRLQSVASNSNSGKGSAGGMKNLVLNISSSKGRNKLPNQSKNITIKVNPASIVKPGSSLSTNSLKNHGSAQKLPVSIVMMNNLPNQGGTGGSLKSGMSGQSNLSLKAQQQIYTIKTSDQLFNLGQKSSALMKKSTPTSLTSTGKVKKKTVAIVPPNKVAKLSKAEGVKKGFTATQGHTIFSVNARQNQ